MTVEQRDLVGVLDAVASGDADRSEAVEELRARGVDTLDVLIEFVANEACSSASLEASRESRSVMRRFIVFSAATLSLVGGVIGTSAAASASTDTTVPSDAATEIHPIVGTWALNDVGPLEDEGFTGAFLSDGVYVEVDTGNVSIGVWEATGPDTVAMSYTSTDEEGSITVRASITVDGDTLTADYTLEFMGEGAPSGEYGPGQVTGTRVVVEPMGTPVGSIEELFSSLEEERPGGTEAAAPPATEAAAPPATDAAAPATEMATPTTS